MDLWAWSALNSEDPQFQKVLTNLSAGKQVIHASLGLYHSYLVLEDGEVLTIENEVAPAKGSRPSGQFFRARTWDSSLAGGLLRNLVMREKVMQVACGSDPLGEHTLVLTALQQVFAWGFGPACGIGVTKNDFVKSPTLVRFFGEVPTLDTSQGIHIREFSRTNVYHTREPLLYRPSATDAPVSIRDIRAGGCFSGALTQDGRVYTWGLPICGRLGYRIQDTAQLHPRCVNFLNSRNIPCVQMAFGYGHVLVISQTQDLYAWGENGRGQLGVGNLTESFDPLLVGEDYVACFAGGFHSLALNKEGKLLSWGANGGPELGHPEFRWTSRAERDVCAFAVERALPSFPLGFTRPRVIKFLEKGPKVKQVTAGHAHTLILRADGSCYGWGGVPSKMEFGPSSAWKTRRPPADIPRLIWGTHLVCPTQIEAGGWESFFMVAASNLGGRLFQGLQSPSSSEYVPACDVWVDLPKGFLGFHSLMGKTLLKSQWPAFCSLLKLIFQEDPHDCQQCQNLQPVVAQVDMDSLWETAQAYHRRQQKSQKLMWILEAEAELPSSDPEFSEDTEECSSTAPPFGPEALSYPVIFGLISFVYTQTLKVARVLPECEAQLTREEDRVREACYTQTELDTLRAVGHFLELEGLKDWPTLAPWVDIWPLMGRQAGKRSYVCGPPIYDTLVLPSKNEWTTEIHDLCFYGQPLSKGWCPQAFRQTLLAQLPADAAHLLVEYLYTGTVAEDTIPKGGLDSKALVFWTHLLVFAGAFPDDQRFTQLGLVIQDFFMDHLNATNMWELLLYADKPLRFFRGVPPNDCQVCLGLLSEACLNLILQALLIHLISLLELDLHLAPFWAPPPYEIFVPKVENRLLALEVCWHLHLCPPSWWASPDFQRAPQMLQQVDPFLYSTLQSRLVEVLWERQCLKAVLREYPDHFGGPRVDSAPPPPVKRAHKWLCQFWQNRTYSDLSHLVVLFLVYTRFEPLLHIDKHLQTWYDFWGLEHLISLNLLVLLANTGATLWVTYYWVLS